jgi:AP-4 complex subunit beta-1
VVANCIMVLNEILLSEGGMAINQPIIHHLLGRMNDFNEWGLHQVLELLSRYSPADDQEVFNIMNTLDPVLRTTNSGVVLATIKAFIHLTTSMTHIHRQLYERIKVPMLTLLAGNVDELVFCILKHIELLVVRCPGIFDAEYKHFYTKFDGALSSIVTSRLNQIQAFFISMNVTTVFSLLAKQNHST